MKASKIIMIAAGLLIIAASAVFGPRILKHFQKAPDVVVEPTSSPQNITANYSCDSKKTINAIFIESEPKKVAPGEMPTPTGSVNLKLSDGRNLTLNQTVSADGGRYANGDQSTIFWDKGSTASVMEGGRTTYANCEPVK